MKRMLPLVLASFALPGCIEVGGGGGSDDPPTPPQPPSQMEELNQIAQAFEFYHRHQPVLSQRDATYVTQDEADNPQALQYGSCDGTLSYNSDEVAIDALDTEADVQTDQQVQTLMFDNYCNDNGLWQTHTVEEGRIDYLASANLAEEEAQANLPPFHIEYDNYQYKMKAYYQMTANGLVRVANNDDTTFNNKNLTLQKYDTQGQLLETYRYSELIFTRQNTGKYYNGDLSIDGLTATVSNERGQENLVTTSAEIGVDNRPTAGLLNVTTDEFDGQIEFMGQNDYQLRLDANQDGIFEDTQMQSWVAEMSDSETTDPQTDP